MMYNKVTPEIIQALEEIVPGRVAVGDAINHDYSKDAMPIYGTKMPEVAIDVLTTEEVSQIMKICYEHHIPVTTRGAGTGLVGGCTPIYGGVVLCMMKMNQILGYDLENFSVNVQAGVLLSQLANDALTKGLMYPPDPGEKLATLGGNVSTNAGGMRAVKYGTTKDYVKALIVVLPNGEILRLGSAVSKTSSGYNLTALITGSEGTLGIITELTLKLVPSPKVTYTLMIPFIDLATCMAVVPKIFINHFKPQAVEFFERDILISSEEYLSKQVFPRSLNGVDIGAYLMISFDDDSEEILDPIVQQVADFLLKEGALECFIADNANRLKDIWSARSSFLEGIEEQTKLLDECDVVIPVNKIADFMAFVAKMEDEFDFEVKYFGHAGDGNLHIYTCSNDMDEVEFKKQAHEFYTALYHRSKELDGQISGEHGIGLGKVDYLKEALGEVNIGIQQGIKKVFDPKMILNPGKVCFSQEDVKGEIQS